jgi:branched-subunit amino acid aminotransferase/4-amino-4-deoxychorismate lyase
MIKQVINCNGIFFDAKDKILTAGNRGFKYADGLFESMRLSKGKVKFAELHAERLQAGMKAVKMEGYSQIDTYFLQDKAEEICRRNKCAQNARLRLTVYRDGAGLYAPTENKFAYVLETSTLNTPLYELNNKGLIMDIYPDIPKPINQLSNYKTCNALLYVMAGIFKEQQKINEAFILNQNGFLCESISANVFLVYENKIYTPALSEGCIGGVMRQVIIYVAQKNNLEIIEAQINPEILNQADEVFLTNASRGIQWVMGFNRKRYFNEMSRFLIDKLNEL